MTSDVAQGTVLGPLLFLVYVNDMPEKISSTIRLFNDESLVYRIIRSKENQTLLQQDLDKLQEWEHDWLMQLNADKSEVIRITNKRNPLTHDYDIHGTKLQTVKNAKGVRALRGKFGPLWSQKLKDAFHQFHPLGLLEGWSKC